jgi:hypothetical protein
LLKDRFKQPGLACLAEPNKPASSQSKATSLALQHLPHCSSLSISLYPGHLAKNGYVWLD